MCASFLCCLACNCMFFPWFINTPTNHALKFTVLKFYCSFICGVQCIRKEQKWKWMYSQNKFSMLTERCFYSETLLRTTSRMNSRIVSDWFASGWLCFLDCLVFCPKLSEKNDPVWQFEWRNMNISACKMQINLTGTFNQVSLNFAIANIYLKTFLMTQFQHQQ